MCVIDSSPYVDRSRVRPGANITLKETVEEARQRLGNGGARLFWGAWANRGEGVDGGGNPLFFGKVFT